MLGSAGVGVAPRLVGALNSAVPPSLNTPLSSARATSCGVFAKEKDHTDKTVKLPGTQYRFYNMHADQKGLTKMGFNHIWALESSQVQRSGLCLVSFWQSPLFFNNSRKTRQTRQSWADSATLCKPNTTLRGLPLTSGPICL